MSSLFKEPEGKKTVPSLKNGESSEVDKMCEKHLKNRQSITHVKIRELLNHVAESGES